MTQPCLTALIAFASLTAAVPCLAADSARDRYDRALAQERTSDESSSRRSSRGGAVAARRRGPAVSPSGYATNALWQAENLAALAFERSATSPTATSRELLTLLAREYPSSKLARRRPRSSPASSREHRRRTRIRREAAHRGHDGNPAPDQKPKSDPAPFGRHAAGHQAEPCSRTGYGHGGHRAEVPYYQEEIAIPAALFDLKGVKTAPTLPTSR